MHVLIIEDDVKVAEFIRKGLAEHRFVPEIAHDGREGLYMLKATTFDAVILDVMMPGVDGWEVLRQLRSSGDKTPVIVLSARDALADRVRGLDSGADDYLVKPFAFSELLARLHTILRRGPSRIDMMMQVADLEIDVRKHLVIRGGTNIELSAKEFQLLSLLARRSGEVLSRTQIAEQVWDMNFDSDANTVDVTIHRLRTKIDDKFEQKLIKTVRGVGYVLAP